jgi:hypothetical protein
MPFNKVVLYPTGVDVLLYYGLCQPIIKVNRVSIGSVPGSWLISSLIMEDL